MFIRVACDVSVKILEIWALRQCPVVVTCDDYSNQGSQRIGKREAGNETRYAAIVGSLRRFTVQSHCAEREIIWTSGMVADKGKLQRRKNACPSEAHDLELYVRPLPTAVMSMAI